LFKTDDDTRGEEAKGDDTRLDECVMQFFTLVSRVARMRNAAHDLPGHPFSAHCRLIGWLVKRRGLADFAERRGKLTATNPNADPEREAYDRMYKSAVYPQQDAE
jgi:hypothetical protein